MGRMKTINDLAEINIKEIMEKAYSEHIAVPAFNIPYLPWVRRVISNKTMMAGFGTIKAKMQWVQRYKTETKEATLYIKSALFELYRIAYFAF